MKFILKNIVPLFISMITVFCANADETVNTVMVDSIKQNNTQKWYKQINKFTDVKNNSVLEDSLKKEYGKDYWKWALFSGELDFKDNSVEYPKFLDFCMGSINWITKKFNSYDSTYVVDTGKNWKIQVKNANWLDSYNLQLPDGIHVGMNSSLSYNLGASISFLAFNLGIMYNIDKLFGGAPVKNRKWEFGFSCALLAFDSHYTKNTGPTNITRIGDYREYNFIRPEYNFPGLKFESYGADLYYFFNNKKYSQSAAYSYTRYQRKSAGSLIAGVTVTHKDVNIDFSSLPILTEEKLIQEKYNIRYNDYCVMFGYAYNWAFSKNWLLNVTLIPCLGINHSLNDVETRTRDLLSTNLKSKCALVFNHDNFFYSLSGRFEGHIYSSKKYKFFNSEENIELVAGFRF